ncbi:unnamed protein product [Staurois parvus]|uniref:Uncharacterized protein n=1 Tax=Staurois parvus TaxID=386267 RepID=A0ABN9BZ95_9NEOB|nr:unnamed protein product [Staurois parvus]
MDSCATQRSPCTSENVARTGTSVSSTIAFSNAAGVPLKLTRSAGMRVRISLCGWCGCMDFHADPQWQHPHRCEPRVIEEAEVRS